MKKEVRIDDLVYVLDFSGNDFSFYLDYQKSNIPLSAGYSEFDDDIVREYDTYHVDQKTVFRLKHEILEFVMKAISVDKPYYFKFSAFNDKKLPVYKKMSKYLASKTQYHLVEEGRIFRFYRV